MKLQIYSDIKGFNDEVMEVLLRDEVQNNVMIANCLRGRDGIGTEDWFLAVVKDNKGGCSLVVLMTPPHNIVLYEADSIHSEEALDLLAGEAVSLGIKIPGVIAEKSLALRFAEKYSSKSARIKKDGMNMRIYRLDSVEDVPISPGRLRTADESDIYFLPYWNMGFASDCGFDAIDPVSSAEKVKNLLDGRNLYIWEDNFPVSQAAMGRSTLNGAVVNAVYTPPYLRGKGYATSCVAALSRHLLDSGYKFCSLFTDLKNPVSNSIYMKIGYKPVCDFDEYIFV